MTGACLRRAATGAVLAVLATLLAATPHAMAQTCTPAGTGTLPTATYTGATYADGIRCTDLTGGLTLTVSPSGEETTVTTTTTNHPSGRNAIDVIGTGAITVVTEGKTKILDGRREDPDNSFGIRVNNDDATGGITMTVGADTEIGTATMPLGASGVGGFIAKIVGGAFASPNPAAANDNDITIVNHGKIHAAASGIFTWHLGTGDTTITTSETSVINVLSGNNMLPGIDARTAGNGAITVTNNGKISSDGEGVYIIGGNDVTVTHAGEIDRARDGIRASNENPSTAATVEVTLKSGARIGADGDSPTVTGDGVHASGEGAPASMGHERKVAVTVEAGARIGTDATAVGENGILASIGSGRYEGAITVITRGKIHAGSSGVNVEHLGSGVATVKHLAGSIVAKAVKAQPDTGKAENDAVGSGIRVHYKGQNHTESDDTGQRDRIMIESAADIESAGHGIHAYVANALRGNSDNEKKIPITVAVTGGDINARHYGIYAATRSIDESGAMPVYGESAGGKITVTVDHGATVIASKDGIYVDGAELTPMGETQMRAQTVTVRGKVMGGGSADDGTKYAGVHMVKGGTVVIGPKAQVSAQSGTAVKANAPGDMVVILEKDADGLFGRIEGKILNTATTVFKTRVGATGATMDLSVGDTLDRRGETKGVYDEVYPLKLATVTGGHEFQEQPLSRFYHDRARVYEALPSVLLDLNGHIPYRTAQTVATHTGDGVLGVAWARVGGGDGRRRMDQATTSKGHLGKKLAWDFSHYGIEAGIDIPVVDKPLQLGLSLHHRQGQAVVKDGGKIEVGATGVGVSAMFRNETGLYMDGRLSYTGFHDIDMNSSERGTLDSDFSGMGYRVNVEGGRRMALKGMDGVTLTPRGGLSWSSVDIDDFDDLAGVQDSGRVSLGSATSLKGRFGVLAETGFGGLGPGRDGRLFASLDVEHEFSSDRNVMASGTKLSSEAEATWGHFRLGGTASWNNSVMGMVTLSGEGFYATAGDGNTDLGAAITLSLRF